MAYKIVNNQFELPPEGVHEAVVFAWEDKGLQTTGYGEKHRAVIKYESISHGMTDGSRFRIHDFLNVAFGEKATLSQRYQQITGRALDGQTFDPNDLMGIKVGIYIVHNEGENGRTYANIAKVKRCEEQDVNQADLENEICVKENPDDQANDPGATGTAAEVKNDPKTPVGTTQGAGNLPF